MVVESNETKRSHDGRLIRSGLVQAALAISLAVFLPSPTAHADVLVFTNGAKVEFPATIEDNKLTLDTPLGPRTFDRSDFRTIVEGHTPEREWRERWLVAEGQNSDQAAGARLAVIRYALDHGLVRQASDALEEAYNKSPNHPPTKRLRQALRLLDEPWVESEEVLRSQSLHPGRFSIARSPHVLLLHQHTAEEASARLELLESVLTAYWLEFSRIGVHLELSRNKLIVFWFATKEGYQERMRANRSQPFLNTRGYFDPVSRVLLLSDARDDPDRRRALAQIETNATRLEAFAQSLESLPRGARIRIDRPGQAPLELDRSEAQAHQEMLTRELKRDRLLWELDWQSLDLAVSAHELVHALVVATGLAPRFESFPTWMHEGLAMQFESVRGGRWGGLAGANLLRRQDWHATNAEADPALANLLLDRGFERGYNQSAYARAWSFVAYLRRDREGSWLGVLDRLRQPIPTQSRSKTWVRDAVLDAANLPLAELERDWLRFMSREGSTSDPVSTEQPRTGQ